MKGVVVPSTSYCILLWSSCFCMQSMEYHFWVSFGLICCDYECYSLTGICASGFSGICRKTLAFMYSMFLVWSGNVCSTIGTVLPLTCNLVISIMYHHIHQKLLKINSSNLLAVSFWRVMDIVLRGADVNNAFACDLLCWCLINIVMHGGGVYMASHVICFVGVKWTALMTLCAGLTWHIPKLCGNDGTTCRLHP